jgi:hypothetical protein
MMYWATSFWEREHSSKRDWMYLERVCGSAPFPAVSVSSPGSLFIGDVVIRRSVFRFL